MIRQLEDQPEASDEMLMVRYQRGDHDAFAALVTRHAADVFTTIYYIFGNKSTAERVAHRAFHLVARTAATFNLELNFKTWLHGQVHHLLVETGIEPSLEHEENDVEQAAQISTFALDSTGHPVSFRSHRSQLLLRRIADRLASLPLDMREAFLFKLVGQLSINSIAEAMSIDSDTVRQLIRSAFDRIQEGVLDTEEYARALR